MAMCCGGKPVVTSEVCDMTTGDEKLRWSADYELGFPMIDGEHRYLVELVGRASEAIERQDADETLSLVNRFVAACQFHFSHEEQVMRDIEFDGIERHIAYHRKLLHYADAVLEQCEAASELASIREHFEALCECLLDDVINGDKEFLPHLEAKGKVVVSGSSDNT